MDQITDKKLPPFTLALIAERPSLKLDTRQKSIIRVKDVDEVNIIRFCRG
jgi:hypothetical protein